MARQKVALSLFWRTFFLLGALTTTSMTAWVGMISVVQHEPQVQQISAQVISVVTITAYTHRKTLDVYFGGVNYAFTPAFTGSVAYYQINQNDYSGGACKTGIDQSTCSGKNKFYSFLGDYSLSKRTHLYAGIMFDTVSGGFSSGFLHNTSNLAGAGIKHSF